MLTEQFVRGHIESISHHFVDKAQNPNFDSSSRKNELNENYVDKLYEIGKIYDLSDVTFTYQDSQNEVLSAAYAITNDKKLVVDANGTITCNILLDRISEIAQRDRNYSMWIVNPYQGTAKEIEDEQDKILLIEATTQKVLSEYSPIPKGGVGQKKQIAQT